MKQAILVVLTPLLVITTITLGYVVYSYKSQINTLNKSLSEQTETRAVTQTKLDEALATIQTLEKESETSTTDQQIEFSRVSFYELSDGSTRSGYPIVTYQFKTANHYGRIEQICENPMHVMSRNENLYCLGDSFLLLDIAGEVSLIDNLAYNSRGDEVLLGIPTFNEGVKTISTSTSRTSATLLVSTNPLRCLWADGLCGSSDTLSYIVDIPSRTVTETSFQTNHYHSSKLVWNDEGTKAFYLVGCPEGCPDDLIYGIDIETNKGRVRLTREVFGEIFYESAVWIDNETIAVTNKSGQTTTFTF